MLMFKYIFRSIIAEMYKRFPENRYLSHGGYGGGYGGYGYKYGTYFGQRSPGEYTSYYNDDSTYFYGNKRRRPCFWERDMARWDDVYRNRSQRSPPPRPGYKFFL